MCRVPKVLLAGEVLEAARRGGRSCWRPSPPPASSKTRLPDQAPRALDSSRWARLRKVQREEGRGEDIGPVPLNPARGLPQQLHRRGFGLVSKIVSQKMFFFRHWWFNSCYAPFFVWVCNLDPVWCGSVSVVTCDPLPLVLGRTSCVLPVVWVCLVVWWCCVVCSQTLLLVEAHVAEKKGTTGDRTRTLQKCGEACGQPRPPLQKGGEAWKEPPGQILRLRVRFATECDFHVLAGATNTPGGRNQF